MAYFTRIVGLSPNLNPKLSSWDTGVVLGFSGSFIKINQSFAEIIKKLRNELR